MEEKPVYTLQQYKKFNGQTVMKALQSLNYHATSNKLSKFIAACIHQPEENIQDTVKRVLSNAVANGFLITRGRSYQLPGVAQTIQKDSRKHLNSRRNTTRKVRKSTVRSNPRARNASTKTVKSEIAKKTAPATKRNLTSRVNKSKLKNKK